MKCICGGELESVPRPFGPGHFKCSKCGKNDSLYSALGRNLFKVEQLPQGAPPIYDEDD